MKNTQQNQKHACMLSLWAPINVPDALGLHATCLPPGDLAFAAARHPQVRQPCRAGAVWGCVVMGGEGLPPGGEMEMPWACFSFPAGTTARAAAAVGCKYEQLS